MVRLKVSYPFFKVNPAIVFQFHYGTIKSRLGYPFSYQVPIFQFHYGTIKRVRKYSPTNHADNFNSTMVRLKEELAMFLEKYYKFQFHYGTIKRFPRLLTIRQVPISIPLWYD